MTTKTLITGKAYDWQTLDHAGWTEGDGSGFEGYNFGDYFDANGCYLGADQHGIEPIVAGIVHTGYVITKDGSVYVQVPTENNQWGFEICDDDQAWAGGIGIGGEWTAISSDDPRITDADRDRLQWILDEHNS